MVQQKKVYLIQFDKNDLKKVATGMLLIQLDIIIISLLSKWINPPLCQC